MEKILTLCEDCGGRYTDIKGHKTDVHSFDKKCYECDKEFYARSNIYVHVKLVHGHRYAYYPPENAGFQPVTEVKVPECNDDWTSLMNRWEIDCLGTKTLTNKIHLHKWDEDNERSVLCVLVMKPATPDPGFTPPRDVQRYPEFDGKVRKPDATSGITKSPLHDYTHMGAAFWSQDSESDYNLTFKRENFTVVLKPVNRGPCQTVDAHVAVVRESQPGSVVLNLAIYNKDSVQVPMDGYLMWEASYLAKIILLPDYGHQCFLIKNENPGHHNFTFYKSSIETVMKLDPNFKITLKLPPVTWSLGGKFKCLECWATFDDLLRRKVHMYTHKGEIYNCPFCTLTFQKPEEEHFINHVMNDHEPFVCEEEGCESVFVNKQVFRQHQKDHDNNRYACQSCDKTFATKRSLTEHVKDAHINAGKKYPCEKCTAVYDSRSGLNTHRRKKHNHGGATFARDRKKDNIADGLDIEKLKAEGAVKDARILQLEQLLSQNQIPIPPPVPQLASTISSPKSKKRRLAETSQSSSTNSST